MTAIIIPVKPLSCAKQRLAAVLSPSQRAGLVLAMLQDVLTVATSLKSHEVWVVTNERAVSSLATQHRAGVITEPVIAGYNAAVTTGFSYIGQHYSSAQNVAIVPADVPLINRDDLSRLTAACEPALDRVRLAPAHDCEGTNGVFLSRPDLLQPVFGRNSFSHYQSDCRANGITPEVLCATSFAMDIDTPFEIKELLTGTLETATGHYLHGLPVSAELLAQANVYVPNRRGLTYSASNTGVAINTQTRTN